MTAVREVPVGRTTVALIDEADFETVASVRWYLATDGRGGGYAMRRVDDRTVYMHRLLLGLGHGGPHVDHINSDGLDNRRENLRYATPAQNHANTRKPRTFRGAPTSSRFKGVCWDKARCRWMASIASAGKARYIGRFDFEEDAARAYDAAALALWGEFARLNFPPANEQAA